MKRKIVRIAAALVLLAAAWIVIGQACAPPERRPVEELPRAEADSPWNVRMEFAGLETVSGEGLAWDKLALRLKGEEPTLLQFCGWPVLVDYWWMGRWYTIGENEQHYLIRRGAGEGTRGLELRFSDGLFGRRGLYRVRLTVQRRETGELLEAGRCSFFVGEPTEKTEGTGVNDFNSWDKVIEEDSLDEGLILRPKRTYIDEDGRAVLEFGLVCNRNFFYYGTDTMRVDRLWQGDWYIVSAPFADRLIAIQEGCVPGQEYIRTREIPPQVLEHPGKYRLYWGGAAYCEFTVT